MLFRYALLLLLILLPTTVLADALCQKLPLDPEFPAGLAGQYEVIGKHPASGQAYVGKLRVSYGKNDYELTRFIGKKAIRGSAWIEQCGIDQIKILHVRYRTIPSSEAACAIAADGDNYYRITCKTRISGQQRPGLEAWFQQR